MFTLYIANKNLSSWSLRSYLTLKLCQIDFTEKLIPIYSDEWYKWQPSQPLQRQVPLLHDSPNDVWISDSLAIALYIDKSYPNILLSGNHKKYADIMMIASEIHSAHASLRQEMPMNLQLMNLKLMNSPKSKEINQDTQKSIQRFDEMICFYLNKYQSDYICGDYGLADIFLTPMASRFITYQSPLSNIAHDYCQKLLAHHLLQEWLDDAREENYPFNPPKA